MVGMSLWDIRTLLYYMERYIMLNELTKTYLIISKRKIKFSSFLHSIGSTNYC